MCADQDHNSKCKKFTLDFMFPEIALEWDFSKNKTLQPKDVSPVSTTERWWICENGHSWKGTPLQRVYGRKCPYCTGKRVLEGKNDIATTHPQIAAQWHPSLNGELTPEMVSAGSGKKIWWLCKLGHEYQRTIGHQIKSGKCPYCSNSRVLAGFNDLGTKRPDIAAQWHQTLNGTLMPKDVLQGSGKKVWWCCSYGHEWQATIAARTSEDSMCPYCSGRLPIEGENDFATKYPYIAKQWDYEKNGELTPDKVAAHTCKKFWWTCEKGHSWCTSIHNRVNGSGCPYCAGKLPITGENDLASIYPEIAKEWNYEKNGTLLPSDVTATSSRTVFWMCSEGHEFKSRISSRTQAQSGCPYCSNKLPIVGENDLATLRPDIAKQWDYSKNGPLHPSHVTLCSKRKVWFICDEQHQWRTSVYRRVHSLGCPYCSGKKKKPQE